MREIRIEWPDGTVLMVRGPRAERILWQYLSKPNPTGQVYDSWWGTNTSGTWTGKAEVGDAKQE